MAKMPILYVVMKPAVWDIFLYHQLKSHNVNCVILVPTTMLVQRGKPSCFIGVKTHTVLSVIVEVGDFNRFATAQQLASYLGFVPGENSGGDDYKKLGITKAGNRHVRKLLTKSAQHYGRGHIGYKSKVLKARQRGNPVSVIACADKANERLRRHHYKMVLGKNKKANIGKTAIDRELACFIWG